MADNLVFRRRASKRWGGPPPRDELVVDPMLVRIAGRQREALRLKAEQIIAAELPRLRAAIETLTATLRGRRVA